MTSDGEVDRLALGLTPEETKTAVWWVEGRARFRGHQAIGHALHPLGGGWALVGWLIRMPPVSWLAAVAYRWVAGNRHRFG
jgi:predicted DCC family thiol-disulfide oxidoreductase YuxK